MCVCSVAWVRVSLGSPAGMRALLDPGVNERRPVWDRLARDSHDGLKQHWNGPYELSSSSIHHTTHANTATCDGWDRWRHMFSHLELNKHFDSPSNKVWFWQVGRDMRWFLSGASDVMWTSLSAVPRKAIKFNQSLTHSTNLHWNQSCIADLCQALLDVLCPYFCLNPIVIHHKTYILSFCTRYVLHTLSK